MGRKNTEHKNLNIQKCLLVITVAFLLIGLPLIKLIKEHQFSNGSKLYGVMFLGAVLISWIVLKDKFKESEEGKKRREQILEEYPEFALKYALLNEAGLTHSLIMERLASEHLRDKNNPLYEELYKAVQKMKGGLSQSEALSLFAEGCNVREVKYFVSLINRNIRKGGKDIAALLRKTADESVKIKREELRKKAEMAGTGLLLPMMLLLALVFVLIMIPAFAYFSF